MGQLRIELGRRELLAAVVRKPGVVVVAAVVAVVAAVAVVAVVVGSVESQLDPTR
jgi:hypothetical protein